MLRKIRSDLDGVERKIMEKGLCEAESFTKLLAAEVLKPILKNDRELAKNLTPVMDFGCPFFRNVLSSQEQSFFQSVLRGKTGRPALIRRYWLLRLSIVLVV